VVGTAFGAGITEAAKLHLAACTMTVKDAVEFTESYLHDNLLLPHHDTELRLPLGEGGCLPVPQGPGLGVSLDQDKVARYVSKILG